MTLAASCATLEAMKKKLRQAGPAPKPKRQALVGPFGFAVVSAATFVACSARTPPPEHANRAPQVAVSVAPPSAESAGRAPGDRPPHEPTTTAPPSPVTAPAAAPSASNEPAPPSASDEPSIAVGPAAGPDEALSIADIGAVIQRHRPAVRRLCWDSLQEREKNPPERASVTAKLTIGKNGKPGSVQVTGDESSAPGLAACIRKQVVTWRFPISSGETHVSIPFRFVRQ